MREKTSFKAPTTFSEYLWDLGCLASLVGIWPRFIEPKILTTTTLDIKLPGLRRDLKGVAFSDLHLHSHRGSALLNRLVKETESFEPDLVFFLGDFLCDSQLYSQERLRTFLRRFTPPLGAYAVLGNHDYTEPVSLNKDGDYDISVKGSHFQKTFTRLTKRIQITKKVTSRVERLKEHRELIETLKTTPFKLLNNQSYLINKKDVRLNVTGLGEYMLGRARPEIAFKGYDKEAPGIILVHNPDMAPRLASSPGQLILSGHTHGGQINLPWIWKKLTVMENPQFKEGLFELENKTLFVSRGVGSVKPFRWYAPPELVLIHLRAG